jgi:hypothetical protein
MLPGVVLLAAAGCGEGSARAPAVAVERAEVITQTVHAGDQATVSVSVEPSSICALRGLGTSDLPVYADIRGVATFSTILSEGGDQADLSLECASPQGNRSTVHPITLRAVPDAEKTSAPTAWLEDLPYPGRSVGPLTEDPELVTTKRLQELGLPLKPDRTRSPGAYARWLEQVSKPSTLVEGPGVETSFVNTISQGNVSDVYAGYVTSGYAGVSSPAFDQASVTWLVPQLSALPVGFYSSSTWAGIGGINNQPPDVAFPQTGTTQSENCAQTSRGTICTVADSLWYEYFPAMSASWGGVVAGDKISANVYFADAAGNLNWQSNTAQFVVQKTQHGSGLLTTFQHQLAPPANPIYPYGPTQPYKDSSEWIMERPVKNGNKTDLAKFATTTFSNPQGGLNASPWGFGFADANAQTQFLNMTNSCLAGRCPLATVSSPINNNTAFTVTWNAVR